MTDKSAERAALEQRADELGVDYAWNLGDDKLKARIEAAEAALAPSAGGADTSPEGEPEQGTAPDGSDTPQVVDGAGDGGATTSPSETMPAPAEQVTREEARPSETPSQDPPETSGLVVRVTGPKQGRWRAGRHFTAEPVEIPLEDLTEDEKRALIGDPKLAVETRAANEAGSGQ